MLRRRNAGVTPVYFENVFFRKKNFGRNFFRRKKNFRKKNFFQKKKRTNTKIRALKILWGTEKIGILRKISGFSIFIGNLSKIEISAESTKIPWIWTMNGIFRKISGNCAVPRKKSQTFAGLKSFYLRRENFFLWGTAQFLEVPHWSMGRSY